MSIDLASTLAALPPLPTQAAGYRAQVKAALDAQKTESTPKIPLLVALDDDPTGTQTCHDVNVLTVWDVDTLTDEFRRTHSNPFYGFFILTNSRALHPGPARQLIQEICRNLKEASAATSTPFEVVLRGDSTLRGHFPLEPEAVESVLGPADAWVLCPFFLQGGRYTIHDVHYVLDPEQGVLVPAAETPFAKDATFGYTSSNLVDYAVEKGRGTIRREDVVSLPLEVIRGGVDGILSILKDLSGSRRVLVVNAAAEEDVDAVVLALLQAAAQYKKRFLFRTGAAFVSARLGIAPIAPISQKMLSLSMSGTRRGGLVIAGSYVPKTTAQLKVLTEKSGARLTAVVLKVNDLLASEAASQKAIMDALAVAEKEIARSQDVLVMTSRDLVVGADEAASLDIGATVARALVSFLTQLSTQPAYVVAKGGITSSDMATKALGFRRARVVGQAAPGVPLWRCDEPTAKWPGLPYVVFPGNVGSNETLYEVVNGWRQT
ncbi:hypothetical protein SEUCBS140593_004976 [Sporothrix eucalyptigena]|uniref:Ketose-bisphosphate aldolase class-II family protein n=1 Tax=Sporothrix eucalyptigena TaxID=1812306 RepID=A0ABP0BTD1_9PEZI